MRTASSTPDHIYTLLEACLKNQTIFEVSVLEWGAVIARHSSPHTSPLQARVGGKHCGVQPVAGSKAIWLRPRVTEGPRRDLL